MIPPCVIPAKAGIPFFVFMDNSPAFAGRMGLVG